MVKREQEIVSFSEYKTLIENFKNKEKVFYRGQADKTYNISCSLSRDYGYVNNENLIIKKTLKIKQKEFEGYKYPVEQLSKIQHYGIPTRLIDITIDPFIALYFAIEDTNNKQDAEVFIFEKEPYDLYSKEANVLS
ncbi:FRG domain-containing protein [Paraclostridium sordellii]|uniref:FRG domain-containing protein n=1 Tax=Paraclostridium sordellii TaxID=1505 RepID=A0A9P1PAW9_PARSO|nr:FRG domain-containing protein [Paeniclostridium sordellii]CEO32721.1 FRG domain-containing protein [[Clostridium] sordellii] [Paeniclostridium sordellii]